jgi:hypothetical protein
LVDAPQWSDLQARGQDALERRVVRRAVVQRTHAGAFQPVCARVLGQAQHALGDVQPIFGTVIQQPLDNLGGGRPNAGGLH